MRLRDLLGISERRQRQTTWLMETALVGFVFVGLYEENPGIVVNAAVGLLVVQLPPLLERDYEIPMDPALVLWITAAVFFHALGTVGLPGMEATFYQSVWWWDHFTHALSSSVVAGAGYAFVRAVSLHVEDVNFPPTFVFALLLLVTLAFGVLWEVLEFAISGLGYLLGSQSVLTQYGIGDTMLDLVFDAVGGLLVAVVGTAYLSDVADRVGELLERRGERA